jgi:peptidoglycan/LPS O-acetylase OafA/YrhL
LEGGEWYTWFTADGLAAGSLLAIVLRTSITRSQATVGAGALLVTATVAMISGVPFGMLSRFRPLGASLLLALVDTFFVGLLLLFLLLGSGSKRNLVNSSVLQFFGYISHGLYLVPPLIFRLYDKFTQMFWPRLQPSVSHFDLVVVRFVVVGAVAVGISHVSRKYYEEWFLRLKDRVAPAPPDSTMKVVLTAPPAPVASVEASEAS